MKHKTTQNKSEEDEKKAHEEWRNGIHERLRLVTEEEQNQFWSNVFSDLAGLSQLIRQSKLSEELRRAERVACLNCDTCKQWEDHLNKWPHNVKLKSEELGDDLLFITPDPLGSDQKECKI